ncbi:hypothetical protein F5148DRAFT_1284083 [Russula earlei]|uniref:Uncharacterized protein n=1 Tax=Russula earlei TaxID=71964 RepID=A0ACC0U9M8_9AGAM|nr:hypothetical protein F5148DRAFT_1284083 [Russula earlei]
MSSTATSASASQPDPTPPPPQEGPNTGFNNTLPSVSLTLYIFSVILIFFLIILGVLVWRTIHRRRLRNATAAAFAAEASGPESKPTLWETYIGPANDGGKWWEGTKPVSVAVAMPVHTRTHDDATHRHRKSRLRFPFRNSGTLSELPLTSPPPEPPPPTSGLAQLTVLISMPTPAQGTARQDKASPPVVELGVTEVAYTGISS